MNGVRVAGDTEDGLVAQLLIKSFSHLYTAIGVAMPPERRAYLSDQASRRSFANTLLYERDGMVIGTVTLVPPSPQCEAWIDEAWDLRLLAVDPAMQRLGIARALMAEAEIRARSAGARMICLHARRGVQTQARFYPACGYTRDPAGNIDGPPMQDGYRKSL